MKPRRLARIRAELRHVERWNHFREEGEDIIDAILAKKVVKPSAAAEPRKSDA